MNWLFPINYGDPLRYILSHPASKYHKYIRPKVIPEKLTDIRCLECGHFIPEARTLNTNAPIKYCTDDCRLLAKRKRQDAKRKAERQAARLLEENSKCK